MFAMVNVQQYDIVSTGSTVAECEINYRQTLAHRGLIDAGDADIDTPSAPELQEQDFVIQEIRSAVVGGNTQYFLYADMVAGNAGQVVFQISAGKAPLAALLNPGDSVTVRFGPQTSQRVGGAIVYTAESVEGPGSLPPDPPMEVVPYDQPGGAGISGD